MTMLPYDANAAFAVFLFMGWLNMSCHGRRASNSKNVRPYLDGSYKTNVFDTIDKEAISRKNQVVEYGSFDGTQLQVRHYTSNCKSCKATKGDGKDSNDLGKGKGHSCVPSAEPSLAAVAPMHSAVTLQPTLPPSSESFLKPSVEATHEPSALSSPLALSYNESRSPSSKPLAAPSSRPFFTPSAQSTSFEPTNILPINETLFKTNSFPDGLESTCDYLPPSNLGGMMKPQRLVFLYYMYVPSGTEEDKIQLKIRDVEQRVHKGLVEEFLTCDLSTHPMNETADDFFIWSISSRPPDDLSFGGCIEDNSNSASPPPENSDCIAAQANLGMIAFFPTRGCCDNVLQSATNADGRVLKVTGDYLDSAMKSHDFDDDVVLQSQFKGFVIPGDPSSGPNVAVANQRLQSNQKPSRIGAGATAMALACLCLVVVVLLTIRRRKRRAEQYLQHLEGMSTYSDVNKDGMSVDHRTHIVGDTSFDSAEEHGDANNIHSNLVDETSQGHHGPNNNQHDVHKVCLCSQNVTTGFLFHRSQSLCCAVVSVFFRLLCSMSAHSKCAAHVSIFGQGIASCPGYPR
jgi:hypothetical protein